MRILLLTPWNNAWIPYYRDEFERRGHEFALGKVWNGVSEHNIVLHGWAFRFQPVPKAKNIVFLRRFELFEGLQNNPWEKVDHLIAVNDWIADRATEIFAQYKIKVPVSVIYNGTDLDKWRFRHREHGNKIGMACHVHAKKNLPLAMQIMALLPEEMELHIAGEIQDSCTAEYLNHLGTSMRRKVYLYGQLPHGHMNLWWDQMNYCLSTSLSEGNPNNVIEAMAKGIKTLVHNWPGAEKQFPKAMRFNTAQEAASTILHGHYDSGYFREIVEDKFSLKNYAKVADLCESLCA